MIITNKINNGRYVTISEKVLFDLEGRCSIQLSYGRNPVQIKPRLATAQATGLREQLFFHNNKRSEFIHQMWRDAHFEPRIFAGVFALNHLTNGV